MSPGSETPPRTSGTFQVGDWIVEPDLNRISRDDTTVHLEPRVMEVLVHLACHGPNLVTRQQLIDGVWDGSFITDNTLTHSIAELRRALQDDAVRPIYIETIHRRGYRLLERVTDLDGRPPMGTTKPSRFRVLVDKHYVQLMEGENLIGRLPEASLCVHSPQISRRHARITVADTLAYLEDLGSKNGTMLNGRRIESRQQLRNGDHIFLGDGVIALQFIETGSIAETDPPDSATLTDPPLEA